MLGQRGRRLKCVQCGAMKQTPARLAFLRSLFLLGSLALLGSCTTQNGDTIVVNGLDCGLVRADLAGNWSVTFLADTATTMNCDVHVPTQNGMTVSVNGSTVVYVSNFAYPGPSGASFNVSATG